MPDFSFKMHHIQLRLGPRPRWGSLQCSPDLLATFGEGIEKVEWEGKRRRKGKGRGKKEVEVGSGGEKEATAREGEGKDFRPSFNFSCVYLIDY